MKPDKHPGLIIALGEPKHGGEDAEDGDGAAMNHEEDMSHEEHAKAKEDAADEMFDSLKHGNKEGFRKALGMYCELHNSPPEDEPSEEDMDGHHDDYGDEEDEDDGDGLRL